MRLHPCSNLMISVRSASTVCVAMLFLCTLPARQSRIGHHFDRPTLSAVLGPSHDHFYTLPRTIEPCGKILCPRLRASGDAGEDASWVPLLSLNLFALVMITNLDGRVRLVVLSAIYSLPAYIGLAGLIAITYTHLSRHGPRWSIRGLLLLLSMTAILCALVRSAD